MHWYVVASQKEARIFIKTKEKPPLKLLSTLPNPLGGEKRRDLIKKQAGKGVKSIGHLGSVHYSKPKRHDPHEDAIDQFVKQIVEFLEQEKLRRSFDSLSVVAEPHLLGKIRSAMREDLKVTVIHWIKKDLQKTPKNKFADLVLGEIP